ncbi:TRAP transporter TAXI family solute receptor [Constrictibacter sp. MBR-5]|jgi:TRAP transporter TAXI family solute receptor|uniref:TAXI family TRAP transporter solute-binding subunit n=1 Tax=Constrictibacter sp. MBR-5 TaxID=3156467 RepID=UPI003392D59E
MLKDSAARAATLAGTVAAGVLTAGAVWAAGLPNPLVATAYDVGSNGYSQAVAIGAAFKNERGITLRLLPGKNDVSRQAPLREGKVHFSFSGIGGYYSQEGAFVFGRRDWGPQAIRILLLNHADTGTVLITAKDAGIKTPADLKGKRVAWVAGAPALNMSVLAHLRFGNLTWDDVKRVDFGGYAASQDGLVDNQVDAAYVNTSAGGTFKLDASPRGLHYPPLPHDDAEAWKRLQEVLPYYSKMTITKGVQVSPEHPLEAGGGPYPLLIAYEAQDADAVYEMTKTMFDLYPTYKDGSPGAEGWALDRQKFVWSAPYHEGAVRYYKEKGVWTPEAQKNNEDMVARQELLQATWKEQLAADTKDEEAFEKAWMKRRADALQKAGLVTPFETW